MQRSIYKQHLQRKATRPREDILALGTLLDAPSDLVTVSNATVVGFALSGAVADTVAETSKPADCAVDSDAALDVLGVAANDVVELDGANACAVVSGTRVNDVVETDGGGAAGVDFDTTFGCALEFDETDVSEAVAGTKSDAVVESTG